MAVKKIDNSSGIIWPFYDKYLDVLFLCGKGDGNIRYYEYNSGTLHYFGNDFKTTVPGRVIHIKFKIY